MPINTKSNYVEFGTGIAQDGVTLINSISLPAPHQLPFSPEFLVEAERNANGTMIIQQKGRTQYTTQLKWEFLPYDVWWRINRWFETYGYVFYFKYFSHYDGKIKIHRFYRGNIEKATPSGNTIKLKGYTVPKTYNNCGFSVIDMGETNVITVEDLLL